MLKRWFKNIKWLLNHPPVNITKITGIYHCDYCGATDNIIMFSDIITICHSCLKQAIDLAMKNDIWKANEDLKDEK